MTHSTADLVTIIASQITILVLLLDSRRPQGWFKAAMIVATLTVIAAKAAFPQTSQPQQPPQVALPVDQPYAQLDADLHALVASINARLAAVTEDMNQLQERLNAMRPKPPPLPPLPETAKPSPQNEQNGPR